MSLLARFLTLVVLTFVATSGVVAQERTTRTLFEVLFGSQNEQQQPQPPVTSQPRAQPQPSAPSAPRAQPDASRSPEIEKSDNARRVAVFGDSLAVDLARALERFYAGNSEVVVSEQAVGSSGFVRDDFFDWNAAIEDELVADSFDVAVVAIGINDRQALNGAEALSDAWRSAYRARLDAFLADINAAGKQVIWLELPPMQQPSYGAAMAQISSIHKAAVNDSGGAWVETYDRYLGEDGGYSVDGPDLNGNIVDMRKGDGIHFSAAGADKLAFYIDRAMGATGGGRVSLSGSTSEVTDLLAGTDAGGMIRPPYQGLEQMRLVEMASFVQDLGGTTQRASDLIIAGQTTAGTRSFALEDMLDAPAGRVDAFGLGKAAVEIENPGGR
ncbi:DUF459 domain-containing protein [Pelagibacterium halotolerans]|uniref:SGNH hydrolase-type esterase domain-containing protein n=1 Tax=Pelagibacterium halotolerans (strain DSM 22347 / JCM 15775 / CGMCC 1.7692 / B2) TaxID=1082931 RepID=G4RC97_PELHB|nr:DUF459 domain-containing protein [Pelagibacterium halotolerans]AEQ52720.1 hypothetical protein KKY_2714 [Pelagibacterium halotolerans B2]QJR17577.1 DUF459 domain-containing protein [Pelagibacterium halotolerans]SEA84984.1 hypothetical protein SAMN05428936_109117 [Pelagibacterium halotolerans]